MEPKPELKPKPRLEKQTSKSKHLFKSKSKLNLKREKTTSEPRSKLYRTSTSKTAHNLLSIDELTPPETTETNAEFFGPDVIRMPTTLELEDIKKDHAFFYQPEATETNTAILEPDINAPITLEAPTLKAAQAELKNVSKDETFFRNDLEVKTICAFWDAQEAKSDDFQKGLVKAFKESVEGSTADKNFPVQFDPFTGAPEVNEKKLNTQQTKTLLEGIEKVLNHIFKNAATVMSPEKLVLLKDVAGIIENKDEYPDINATVSSVLFMRILMTAINQVVDAAKASSPPAEIAVMKYIQQTLMSFASDPTGPVRKSKLTETKKKSLLKLMTKLEPGLNNFMKTLLRDLPVTKT